MTSPLPTIASFWFGSDLSWMEALCIQSYLDHGHNFVLYVPHAVKGIPNGVEVRPATEILWPAPYDVRADDRLGVAVFSDIFRLRLLQKTDSIWVDLDAYCVKPFDFSSPFVFGQAHSGHFPTGVLRLPASSETLQLMLDFVTSANPTQPWRGAKLHRRNRRRVRLGETWGIESLPWGSSGPNAFAHFLRLTEEGKHAMAADVFYPLAPQALWKLHDPRVRAADIEGDAVHSVHFYGHQKKQMATKLRGLPIKGSYLDQLCARHGIDPAANPIVPLDWMKPAQSVS
ncbi:hypothetical protein [Ruegeria halocynthiae]|uniref:hypothetical protein n=1 Tax=Ruegeria halocynthiae TaxID=985054 RepID=UPI000568A3F9|nr:hypothetical protein [Ruegeria halocynthiae]